MLSKPPFLVVKRRFIYFVFVVVSFCTKIVAFFVECSQVLGHLLLSSHTVVNHKLFHVSEMNPDDRGNFIFTWF